MFTKLKMDSSIYDSIKPGHDYYSLVSGPEIQKFWHENKFKEVNKRVVGRFLDVGSSSGAFLLFNKKGICLDPSFKQLKFGKVRFNSHFVNGEAQNLPFKDKSFDTLIAVEIIEHLDKKYNQLILKELKRVAKKKIIITTPNYSSLWPLIEFFLSKINPINYKEEHINKFTFSSAKKLFKEAKITSFYIVSPFLTIISKKLSNLLFKIEKKLLPFMGSLLIIEIDLK